MSIIVCTANRGRKYEITVNEQDEPVAVHVRIYQNPATWTLRRLWQASDTKPMTTTVACALRAAVKVRDSN